ncbi:nucleoside phosphorylase domain-containing protein [Aspergillus pseudoustus]|uniref:Nucleoside phosphorylase domain-containing protein n=1 Tax=Aspergillus pseudoustus TaxID=1810923 RepID=A0ABR4J6Y1_9EURO
MRDVLGARFPPRDRDSRSLGRLNMIIVVKLVPDWWKIASLFLLLGCMIIAWTNKPANGAVIINIIIIIIPVLVAIYLACYTLYRLLDRYEVGEDENDGTTSAGDAWAQMRYPEQPKGRRRPRLQHHNTWNGTGTMIGDRISRTYSLLAPNQSPSYNDYNVGWISALPIELAAARAMLDEIHQPLLAREFDDNTYVLGRIGFHNVVITCLPYGVYGPVTAAAVATRMRSTFQSIRLGLMVGIGGGVPSQGDIRQGDVVVSKPSTQSGGVLQCDTEFEQTSTLNNPPHVLLNALANLQAIHIVEGNCISGLVSTMLSQNPALKDSVIPTENDRLFAASYDHCGAKGSCKDCDERHLIVRKTREQISPQVHYGQIASVTRVLRNGTTRDEIAKRLGGTLCFEMEAAGLMDNFPCLVIRGISDYADSHKNDHWQGYAAATAAAYAKELLSVIAPREIATQREVFQQYRHDKQDWVY